MDVYLKNIKMFPKKSVNSIAFTAELMIDQYRAGTAYNWGHGGPVEYDPINAKGMVLITLAEDYFKKYSDPKVTFNKSRHEYSRSGSLARHLHDQISNFSRQEAQKQAEIEMKNGIVYGNWNHTVHVIRLSMTIEEILNRKFGIDF